MKEETSHQEYVHQETEVSNEDPDPLGSLFETGAPIECTSCEHQSKKKHRKSQFKISLKSLEFLRKNFPGTTLEEWNDWKWQLRHSITSQKQLQGFLNLSEDEYQSMVLYKGNLPLRMTPYYASLLDIANPLQGLRRSVIPVAAEYTVCKGEAADPLGEDGHSPVEGLVHRYPDRVLFLVTGFCSTYCRYCTRSRMVGDHGKSHLNRSQWDKALEYIRNNPAIRDVLLSGGDPLTLSDEDLEYLLSRLRKIPHVEFLRIGSKVPAVLPQRITPELVRILKKYHPLWMSIHFTHPDELTEETSQACERLADAGIPLGSQTVLLKDINDHVPVMKKLVQGLLKIRVKPYYLYQCDPILGSSHFRTSVSKGLEIIKGLRGFTSGYAVPHYVIDAPAGGGKIPLLPEYYLGKDGEDVLLQNYEGKVFRYPDSLEMQSYFMQ
jgi:lysine 2,3-aminomutase